MAIKTDAPAISQRGSLRLNAGRTLPMSETRGVTANTASSHSVPRVVSSLKKV